MRWGVEKNMFWRRLGSGRAVRGHNYEKMGYNITIDRILPRVLKIATLPPKIAHPYPLTPPIPWKLETLPFLLLIFIIHIHLYG